MKSVPTRRNAHKLLGHQQILNFHSEKKICVRKMKVMLQERRKDFQMTYLTNTFKPENMKNSQNSTLKKQTIRVGKWTENINTSV